MRMLSTLWLKKLKPIAKRTLAKYPALFFPVYRVLAPQALKAECLLREGVELVIEGYPRSANTFAVVAFRHAQGRNVPLAHHLHVEAQIIKAAELGIPVLVLIRNPVDAIKSLLIRHPEGGLIQYANWFTSFYEAIEPVKGKVVIADFTEVTSNFGLVIRRVNEKFGTNFTEFVHSDVSMREVFAAIDEINEQLGGESPVTFVARPVAERNHIKVVIDQNIPEVVNAMVLYRKICFEFGLQVLK